MLGSARPLWDRLSDFAAARCRGTATLKFYGRDHGWARVFVAVGSAADVADVERLADAKLSVR